MKIRVEREHDRTCDGCDCWRREIRLITIGGKRLRLCSDCVPKLNRAMNQVAAGDDACEVYA